MNKPYKKQFDKDGKLLNPIVGKYVNSSPNRRQRRKVINDILKYTKIKNK